MRCVLGGAMTFGGNDTPVGRAFLQRIRDEVRPRLLEPLRDAVRIEFASLGGDAGYIGAAGPGAAGTPKEKIADRAGRFNRPNGRLYAMELDDELCLCFHVTKRKVINFLRVERPQRESQLADCHGAGTGCGWCRPFLKKLFEAAQASDPTAADLAVGRRLRPRPHRLRSRRQRHAAAGRNADRTRIHNAFSMMQRRVPECVRPQQNRT